MQWTSDLTVEAMRGTIYDRSGNALAQSATAMTVVLQPKNIKDAELVADTLSEILDMDRKTVYERATRTDIWEIWLKRQISDEQVQQIRAAQLDGVAFVEDTKRFYPRANFLSQTLGYTTIDGLGQEGLEASYNKYLQGMEGRVVSERGNDGRRLPFGVEYYEAAKDGYDLVTTIDYVIQSFAEQAVEDGMLNTGAKKIECIVMDPQTGAIYAMVKKPDVDNNNLPRDDLDLLMEMSRNTIITDVYEPGSTFKMITTAASLEEGLVNPDSNFYCSGHITVDGERIKCWRSYNPHGSQDFRDALKNSCNPVFVQLATNLGTEKFYDYIYAFGFGQKTGVDLNGEVGGIVTSIKYVKNVDLARIGFGQSIAVTPMQMIAAASAVVNGGRLMQPYLVSEIRDGDDILTTFDPMMVRQVISQETSATMRELLQYVVDNGVATARIEGLAVGGKTGTAQKYDENGRIMPDKHIGSFIGFAPADDPQLICLVTVDEAQGGDFGSQVAAPIAREIIEKSMKYFKAQGARGNTGQDEGDIRVPDVVGLPVDEARREIEKVGLTMVLEGDENIVTAQMPEMGARVAEGSQVRVYAQKQNVSTKFVLVPDLKGKTLEEAQQALDSAGLRMEYLGDEGGVVVSQSVGAGRSVAAGSKIFIELKEP
ncbi:MAG: penicillin-binding transpeptidase domain-containing protein [Christensenellales bacterium]